MESISFNITERSSYGTGSARESRRNGMIPAVIYGPNKDNMHFMLQVSEVMKIKDGLKNKDITLIKDSESIKATVKAIQYHPVKDSIMHIDFIYN